MAAKTSLPRKLSDMLMQGQPIDVSDIDKLRQETEGLYHDFKSGNFLRNNADAAAYIRTRLAAFCNSDGGMLVIGVSDGGTRQVDGCPAKMGSSTLTEWSTNVLSTIAPRISPPIRIQELQHPDGLILIIGVLRNRALVPVPNQGRESYWFRHGSESKESDPWLISDLLLGRRVCGDIRLSVEKKLNVSSAPGRGSANTTIGQDFVVENAGLTWVDDFRAGIIGWTIQEGNFGSLPHALASYIDAEEAKFRGAKLIHFPLVGASSLPAFSQNWLNHHTNQMFQFMSGHYTVDVGMAVYVVEKNANPKFYQLTLEGLNINGADPHIEESTYLAKKVFTEIYDSPIKVYWKRVDER